MTAKLIMTKGLPGSGKSTWANKYVLDAPAGTVVRTNKDTLREMLHAGRWKGKATERQILAVRDAIVNTFLEDGLTVIVDDTNFVPSHEEKLRELARDHGAEFIVMDFTDVPLDVCLERDRGRQIGQVGPEVIIGMWERHVRKPRPAATAGRPAVIVDLDGTLAHTGGRRSPYDFSKVGQDDLDPVVRELVGDARVRGDALLIVSGRDDSSEGDTRKWLKDKGVLYDALWMRKTGDKRPDREIKEEIYRANIVGKFDVRYVIDDRDSVVAMWRTLGLKTIQVEYGAF